MIHVSRRPLVRAARSIGLLEADTEVATAAAKGCAARGTTPARRSIVRYLMFGLLQMLPFLVAGAALAAAIMNVQ